MKNFLKFIFGSLLNNNFFYPIPQPALIINTDSVWCGVDDSIFPFSPPYQVSGFVSRETRVIHSWGLGLQIAQMARRQKGRAVLGEWFPDVHIPCPSPCVASLGSHTNTELHWWLWETESTVTKDGWPRRPPCQRYSCQRADGWWWGRVLALLPFEGRWDGIDTWGKRSQLWVWLSSAQFSCSVMSNSLWPHGPQHTRLPRPSPAPGAYSNSCP